MAGLRFVAKARQAGGAIRSRASGFQSGQVVAIPVRQGESLPRLPDTGISSMQEAIKLAGGRAIETDAARGNRGETDIAPGLDPSIFAYVKENHPSEPFPNPAGLRMRRGR
jgi:hypothetical protein